MKSQDCEIAVDLLQNDKFYGPYRVTFAHKDKIHDYYVDEQGDTYEIVPAVSRDQIDECVVVDYREEPQ